MENPITEQSEARMDAVVPQPKAAENSPYAQYRTDSNLEKSGIVLDYDGFTITIARAGGSNVQYTKVLDSVSKPYRRAIQNETINPNRVKKIFREVYARTIVKSWTGMVDPQGNEIPFNVANCIRVFEDLDDLFIDVQEQAQKSALFKTDITEGDLGN